MALDNVTSHFSTMLEQITSASFLSSLSIIHGRTLYAFASVIINTVWRCWWKTTQHYSMLGTDILASMIGKSGLSQ